MTGRIRQQRQTEEILSPLLMAGSRSSQEMKAFFQSIEINAVDAWGPPFFFFSLWVFVGSVRGFHTCFFGGLKGYEWLNSERFDHLDDICTLFRDANT